MPRYPGEVVVDGADADAGTPAGEPDDDFFSSWDKPAIKRPTPPVSRTASPFLNAGNGTNRSASPLSKQNSGETTPATAKPTTGRITSSSALRKTGGTTGGAKKTSVLGAKKPTKLGAKKVNADAIDFDAAEKSAREEAERIEKLGYDPNAEEEKVEEGQGAAPLGASPAPVSPPPPSSSSAGHTRQKSNAEVERLGMGVGRLGFGQIGGGKAASAAPAKKNAGGFGSVGPVKAEGKKSITDITLIWLTPLQKSPTTSHVPSSAHRKASHPTSTSAAATSTPTPSPRPRRVFKALRVPRPSHPTPTSGDQRTRIRRTTTATWRARRRTLSASSASLPVTTSRT